MPDITEAGDDLIELLAEGVGTGAEILDELVDLLDVFGILW